MSSRMKKMVIALGVLVTLVIVIGVIVALGDSGPKLQKEATSAQDQQLKPSAAIDLDTVAPKPNELNVTKLDAIDSSRPLQGDVVTKEKADEILSVFSKKVVASTSAKTNTVGNNVPNLGAPSPSLLPLAGQPIPNNMIPTIQPGGNVFFGQQKKTDSLSINGIICEKGKCYALTSVGTIRVGSIYSGSKVVSIDTHGIKTEQQFFNY